MYFIGEYVGYQYDLHTTKETMLISDAFLANQMTFTYAGYPSNTYYYVIPERYVWRNNNGIIIGSVGIGNIIMHPKSGSLFNIRKSPDFNGAIRSKRFIK